MFFTPIINFPEVAILGTGRISEKAVVKNGDCSSTCYGIVLEL